MVEKIIKYEKKIINTFIMKKESGENFYKRISEIGHLLLCFVVFFFCFSKTPENKKNKTKNKRALLLLFEMHLLFFLYCFIFITSGSSFNSIQFNSNLKFKIVFE